jgi:hypothetical protein
LKTLDAVKQVQIAKDKYFELIKDIEAKAILVFCRETYEQVITTVCLKTRLREVQMGVWRGT